MSIDPLEADVVIEGQTLTRAESMTLRVAVTAFLMTLQDEGLGDDENGKAISEGYQRACKTILNKMILR